MAQFVSPETGTVAVAFPQSLGSWLVPDLLGSFRAVHPGVGFRLTNVRDELHGLPLDRGAADLEIGTRRFRTGAQAIRPGDLSCTSSASPTSHSGSHSRPVTRSPPRWRRPAGPSPLLSSGPTVQASGWPTSPASRSSACGPRRRCASWATTCARRRASARGRLRGRRPVQRPRPGGGGPGRRHRPLPPRRRPVAGPGPVLYLPILDDGAERDIYLTWPADSAPRRRTLPRPRHRHGHSRLHPARQRLSSIPRPSNCAHRLRYCYFISTATLTKGLLR